MKKLFAPLLVILYAFLFSCSSGDSHGGHFTVYNLVREKQVDGFQPIAKSNYDMSTVLRAVTYDSCPEFFVEKREGKISLFACTECHSAPISELQKGISKEEDRAHWNIKLKHGEKHGMDCFTCHEQSNFDRLHTTMGKEISFDRSYLACAQCHSPQFNDWKWGAHGKMNVGWGETPKVRKGCVECHNPHSPAFGARTPKRLISQGFVMDTTATH